MRYLIVNDDATPDDLREAITHLREKQRRAVIQSTRDELDADMGELLDLLAAKVAVGIARVAIAEDET